MKGEKIMSIILIKLFKGCYLNGLLDQLENDDPILKVGEDGETNFSESEIEYLKKLAKRFPNK